MTKMTESKEGGGMPLAYHDDYVPLYKGPLLCARVYTIVLPQNN